MESLENALDPFTLEFRELTSFVFGLLMTLAATLNAYGKRKAPKMAKNKAPQGDHPDEQEDVSDAESDADPEQPDHTQTFNSFADWEQDFRHFKVKCLIPVAFIISMLVFIHNS
ncbi:hypothetical protein K439DRAFT_1621369 [Ramaria rubella]|nr:hypothetical protein K439DRAFT_1621369 [Ramaria rubella]